MPSCYFLQSCNVNVSGFQDEESSIQKLNLSDCKLRTEINNVINALVPMFTHFFFVPMLQ
jgi:hypothetical protein